MHERTDRQMDGQMQMGGRTNGWMDRPSYRDVKAQLKSKSSLQKGKKLFLHFANKQANTHGARKKSKQCEQRTEPCEQKSIDTSKKASNVIEKEKQVCK